MANSTITTKTLTKENSMFDKVVKVALILSSVLASAAAVNDIRKRNGGN